MKVCILSFLLTLSSHFLYAQRYYPSGTQSREQLGVSGGISRYYGDLQEEGFFASTTHFMLHYEYHLSSRWAVRADGGMYQLEAYDANSLDPGRRNRNLSFHSTNFELSSSLLMYLFRKLPVAYTERPVINIYGLLGLGGTFFNPKANYQGTSYPLRDFETEGKAYSRLTPVIPLGMGIQIKVSNKMDIALETSYRFTFSDYLDDVSTVYRDQDSFGSELAAALADRRPEMGLPPVKAGSQRGNPSLNDGYAFYSFRVSFYLEKMYYQALDKKNRWGG